MGHSVFAMLSVSQNLYDFLCCPLWIDLFWHHITHKKPRAERPGGVVLILAFCCCRIVLVRSRQDNMAAPKN